MNYEHGVEAHDAYSLSDWAERMGAGYSAEPIERATADVIACPVRESGAGRNRTLRRLHRCFPKLAGDWEYSPEHRPGPRPGGGRNRALAMPMPQAEGRPGRQWVVYYEAEHDGGTNEANGLETVARWAGRNSLRSVAIAIGLETPIASTEVQAAIKRAGREHGIEVVLHEER